MYVNSCNTALANRGKNIVKLKVQQVHTKTTKSKNTFEELNQGLDEFHITVGGSVFSSVHKLNRIRTVCNQSDESSIYLDTVC